MSCTPTLYYQFLLCSKYCLDPVICFWSIEVCTLHRLTDHISSFQNFDIWICVVDIRDLRSLELTASVNFCNDLISSAEVVSSVLIVGGIHLESNTDLFEIGPYAWVWLLFDAWFPPRRIRFYSAFYWGLIALLPLSLVSLFNP